MVSGTISSNLRCGGSQVASRATRFLRRGGAVRHPHGLSGGQRVHCLLLDKSGVLRRQLCAAVVTARQGTWRWSMLIPSLLCMAAPVAWRELAPVCPGHCSCMALSRVSVLSRPGWSRQLAGTLWRPSRSESWNRLDHRSPVGQDWGCGVLHGALGGPGGGPGSAAQASSATQEPAGEGQNRGKSSHCGGRLGRASVSVPRKALSEPPASTVSARLRVKSFHAPVYALCVRISGCTALR